jgi:transposase IS116/IS110/IS902 family protein
VIPRLRQSGKRRLSGRRMLPLGNARLRRALWMPTLSAIRINPWLRAYYLRLRAAGKRPKVALIAAMRAAPGDREKAQTLLGERADKERPRPAALRSENGLQRPPIDVPRRR